MPWKNRKLGVCLCVVTRQPGNVDSKDLAQIKTFVVMGPGDQGGSDIIIGSARQDLSKIETGIQTLDRSVSIISTTGIPFPASTRNHKSGDYITGMNHERVWMITDGFATGFLSGMYSCFCFQVHPTPQVYWTMVRSPTGHGQASF